MSFRKGCYFPTLMALIFLSFLYSCSDNSTHSFTIPMQEMQGRDYESKRFNLYRARVPLTWLRKDCPEGESLSDTTKPICEFFIKDADQTIRITLHNFATDSLEKRIPPSAQIARWQRQFERLYPEESSIIPQAFSGYSGLKFKGVGEINQLESMMLGWSLQLCKEHFRTLTQTLESPLSNEMCADVTIKAVGPKEFMEIHEDEITQFARSFELIEEIPYRS